MKKISLIMAVIMIAMISFTSCANYTEKKAAKKREAFVADSLAKREVFVADSLAKREAYVADSLAKREAYVADSLAYVARIEEIRSSIRITSYWLSSANSAGGRDIHFNYQNLSKKTIKYLTFSVTFYNAVDDLAYCEIRDSCTFNGRDTGPVLPNRHSSGGYWENAIYNYQAKKMVLNTIKIEYTDSTSLTIEKDELTVLKGYNG